MRNSALSSSNQTTALAANIRFKDGLTAS